MKSSRLVVFSITFVLLICSVIFSQQVEVVFVGYPTIKIEVADGQSSTRNLTTSESKENAVVIKREGDKYYWASRQNKELILITGTAYNVFLSPEGLGYIKIQSNLLKTVYDQLPKEEKEKAYCFMEHVTNQLGGITYFGRF